MSSQPAGIPTRAGTPVLPTPALPFAAPSSAREKSPGTAGADVQHFENLLSKATATPSRPGPNAPAASPRTDDPASVDSAASDTSDADAAGDGDKAPVAIRPRKPRAKGSEEPDADTLLVSLAFMAPPPPPPQPTVVAPIDLATSSGAGQGVSEESAPTPTPGVAAGDALISQGTLPEPSPLKDSRPTAPETGTPLPTNFQRTEVMDASDAGQTPDKEPGEKKGDWIEGLKPDRGATGKNAAEVLKEGVRAVPAAKVDLEKVAATSRQAGIAGLDLIGKAKVTESARKVDAGRSSTTASPGGTWSAQQASDVTVVENNLAEATPAKAPVGARFARSQESTGSMDLAASVAGVPSTAADVANIPQELVETTSVKEPREVMLDQILDHAATVRQSGHDSLGVTIRANERTEILVHFKYVDGVVHAQAQFERGDVGLLNSQWQDLQAHLARQGVTLSPLQGTNTRDGGLGQQAQNGQGQSRQSNPGDTREGQGWTGWNQSGSTGARGAATTPRRAAAGDHTQHTLGLLETWA